MARAPLQFWSLMAALLAWAPVATAQDEGEVEDLDPPARSTGDARALIPVWGATLGGWVGGTVGYAVGDAADGVDGRGPGATTGTLLGSGVGLGTTMLVMRLQPEATYSHDQFAVLASSSALGAWTGMESARAFIPPGDADADRRIALAGALGAMAGTGLGLALTPRPPPSNVMWSIDLGTLIGWQAAAGGSDMGGLTLPKDRQRRAGISLAGGVLGGAAVGTLRAAGVEGPSAGTLAVSLSEGAWIGAWAPLLVTRTPEAAQVWGGLRLGLGGGYVLGQALAPFGRPDGRTVALQSALWASGTTMGAGLPLAIGVNPDESDGEMRAVVSPMLATGLVGLTAGTFAGPHYELSDNDVALLTTLGVWTGYQAIGWGFFGDYVSAEPYAPLGYALTTAGFGTAFATVMAPMIEVETQESLLVASMGGWATWYGAWIGHLANLDPETHWGITLAAGNVALLTTAGLAAGPMHADWTDLALIDGMTAVGGATGALIGLIASPEVDPVATASLIGTTVGMAGGIYLASRTGGGDSVALPLLEPLNLDLPVDAHVMARPWIDDRGKTGVWVDLRVTER